LSDNKAHEKDYPSKPQSPQHRKQPSTEFNSTQPFANLKQNLQYFLNDFISYTKAKDDPNKQKEKRNETMNAFKTEMSSREKAHTF